VTSPATALLRLVASGQASAADLVSAHLARLASIDPSLRAMVDVDGDRALAAARRQDDRAARGEPRGPLGGLPVTVKSAIAVEGLRCEAGSPAFAGIRADRDATVVARLRRAGAIVLGTTNVSEMLMSYGSDNPLHGRTVNPWDRARTAGGSSSGEAAAIAAGASAAGLGSDGGGSVRVPAHFCGICALKPTPGRIPATGHQPACLGPFSLVGAIGPMARTIDDLRLIDRVVAGWDGGDPMSAPVDANDEAMDAASLTGLRVACVDGGDDIPVTFDTRAALQRAAQALEEAGLIVEARQPAALRLAGPLWDVFFAEAALIVLTPMIGEAARALPILAAHLARTGARSPLTAEQLTTAWIERDLRRAELLAEMEEWPILIGPVAAIPAFGHDERAWTIDGRRLDVIDAMRFSQWFNVLGNPAATVPVMRGTEGLPIGVQVVGRPFADRQVLAVAAEIERRCGGYSPPPGLPG
jgi:amidase